MNISSSITLIETIGATDHAIAAAGYRACAAGTFASVNPVLIRLKEQQEQALEALRADHLEEGECIDLLEGIVSDCEAIARTVAA